MEDFIFGADTLAFRPLVVINVYEVVKVRPCKAFPIVANSCDVTEHSLQSEFELKVVLNITAKIFA